MPSSSDVTSLRTTVTASNWTKVERACRGRVHGTRASGRVDFAMATKVIVIGGGVAGMTAAQELASRPGFEVVVFEQRPVAGGKARSMDAIAGVGGRRALPGEHG